MSNINQYINDVFCKHRGIWYFIFSLTGMSIASVIAKYLLMHGYSVGQTLFVRCVISFVLLLPFILVKGVKKTYKCDAYSLKFYFLRVTMGILAMILWFYSLRQINNFANAIAISLFVPYFVLIFSIFLLKEKTSTHVWIGLVVGTLGAILIIQPGSSAFQKEYFIVFFATMIWGLGSVLQKKLVLKTDRFQILSVTTTMYVVFFLPFSYIGWMPIDNLFILSLFILLGLISNICNWFFIKSMEYESFHTLMPFEFVRFVLTAILGYIVFASTIDLYSIIGAILIVGGATYVLKIKNKKNKKDIEIIEDL